MKLLLDTHLLLWAAGNPGRLSLQVRKLIEEPKNQPLFSSASIWEIVIKNGLGRQDFQVDSRLLRRGLLENGYTELPVSTAHVLAVESLPNIHKDPFDRILVSQSLIEGMLLITADASVARYPGSIHLMRSIVSYRTSED